MGTKRAGRVAVDRASPADLMQRAVAAGPAPMNIGAVLVLGTGPGFTVAQARRRLGERIPAVPRLRQRLHRAPPGCGRPYWADDPRFALDRHVREMPCPAPGDERALLDTVAALLAVPLPWSRPLWAVTFVTGLAGGGTGLVIVMDHVLADGIGGLALLARLVDGAPAGPPAGAPAARLVDGGPAGPPAGAPAARFPVPPPGPVRLATDAWAARARGLALLPGRVRQARRGLAELGGTRMPGPFPPTSLNRPTGPGRRIDVLTADLGAIRGLGRACGGTVTDVILAAVTGALRALLASRGEPLDRVTVSVPVSGRPAAAGGELGNQVGVMPVSLPATGRLATRVIQTAVITRERKRVAGAPGAGASAALLGPVFRLLAPTGLLRCYFRRQRRVHTFVTSLRGPAGRVTFAGAPVRAVIPVPNTTGNVPVTFGVLSCATTLWVSVVSDPSRLPDVGVLTAALHRELGGGSGGAGRSGLCRAGHDQAMLRWGRHHGRVATHPVTVTVGPGPPGPVVPGGFAGLSFERGPLNPGHAGVQGYLFSPENGSLVTLLRSMGLRSLRIGGGSVDHYPPAGTGPDGYTGIDQLFAFAAAAGTRVIYSVRLLGPAGHPAGDLITAAARAAGHIWRRYPDQVASFAIGNEPDWHAAHSYPGHPLDPAIYEEEPGVPGSAYPSYLATWRRFAAAIGEAAPGAPLCGPDTGAYSPLTNTGGVSWTERFAGDERDPGRVAEVTQHYYAGGDPGKTTAGQAIRNMLSPEWVRGTARGRQPRGTVYTPYPWLYRAHLAPVAAAGLRYRLTESNDYLTGVPGASNAFASALWALDHLHWWAAHGAAGVSFHNKQWLWTDTVVPDPARPGRYALTPKGYGIGAFTVGSAGRSRPVTVTSPGDINVTAYCAGGPAQDLVTVINKTHGAAGAAADVTIAPAAPPVAAEFMTLASSGPGGPAGPGEPGDAAAPGAVLGGAPITGDAPWEGTWSGLAAGPAGIRLTVPATTAVIARIRYRAGAGARPG